MKNFLAHFFSWVFQPLILPTYFFLFALYRTPPIFNNLTEKSKGLVLLLVAVSTFLIPLISIIVMRLTSLISNFSLSNRKERILPFIFIMIFYGFTAYLFTYELYINKFMSVTFTSLTLLILIALVITFFYQISIHSAAISGLLGFLVAAHIENPQLTLIYPICAMMVISGIVMTSRLQLNAHLPMEVFWGGLLGFSFTFITVFVF